LTSYGATIGTTVDIKTISADQNRKSIAVFNKHTTAVVYMKEGNEVSADNGIPIYPQGNISLNHLEDGDSIKEAWSFISDTVDTGIIIFEGV